MSKLLPTVGYCAAVIPFIVHPIDNGIHALMNFSLRPAMKKYICGPGQGNLADLDMCEEECNVPEEGEPMYSRSLTFCGICKLLLACFCHCLLACLLA